MPVPRTTVSVGGLDGMADAFDALGDALGREAQKGLNEVSTNALKRLGTVVDREVDGGAVAFSKVALNGRSSMSMRRGRYADGDDEAESDVHVNELQSRYLKYLLGEEEVRRAGDTGVAKEWNFVPVNDAFPYLDEQGADPEHGQNLKRGTLARLFKRAEAQKRKVAEARAKGKAPRLTGPLRFGRLFFGEVGGTMGLYERPVGRAVSLKLLILAQKKSEYRAPSGYLLPGWNRSVSDAMATYPARMRRRLAEETARIAASSGASGGGGGGGPP